MDTPEHDEESVHDDELLYDREREEGEAAMAAGMGQLEIDEPLVRETRPRVPPPPPRSVRTLTPQPFLATPPPMAPPREASPLRPGDVLAGRYHVDRVAGRSGLGVVVHVRHADLGQRLVLKYLPLDACKYPDSTARFLRGARSAMRLQGEHTARTVDAGRLSSGAPYVVSEALPGCDLQEMLRVRGAVTISEAVDFVLQAAEALSEAHAQGFVHGSISALTLFATRRPDGSASIKVLDFGIAQVMRPEPMRANELNLDSSPSGANAVIEALACSSPEQLRGSLDIDARTDIWALGAVLHELLSGHPVYQAETIPGLLAMVVADPPLPVTSFRPDAPAALEAVILRCLAKDRNARFATVAELAVALRDFASPELHASVDRITRTLARSTRQQATTPAGFAMIHIGPAPSPPPAPAPPRAAAAATIPYPLLWSTLLVAFGLVGGTIAGVLVATRGGPGVEHQVQAAQPAPASLLPPPDEVAVRPEPSALAARTPPVANVAPQFAARPAAKPKAKEETREASEPNRVAPAQPARNRDFSRQSSADDSRAVATGQDLFDSMR
jgi:eukaryotic-like serine/threonine-protein kinase